jgi:acyl-ACP thioesterase
VSASPGGTDLVARPGEGRLFTRQRRVRLGDASPAGRLRLDAVVRYAQDLARDDSRDADLELADAWVVRRTTVEVANFPVYDEALTITTWCSGVGSRWADRRTSIVGEHDGRVEVVSLWVAVDPATGRPRVLGPDFAPLYGVSAQGRVVSARLQHPAPPPDPAGDAWPLRFTDFDVLGHVNNAAYWEPVEEVLAHRRDLRAPLRAELEHPQAIELGAAPRLVRTEGDGGAVALWLVGVGGVVHASAVLRMSP